MTPRRIGYLALFATGVAAGWFFFTYLTRWEWNRAVVSALIFLAAELGLLGALVLDRIGKLRREVAELRGGPRAPTPAAPSPEVLARVREAAPATGRPFEWLEPDRTTVFIPVLLGAGVIVSAIAWTVERLARVTAGAQLEQDLAARLRTVALPHSLLLSAEDDQGPSTARDALDESDASALLHPTRFP